MENVIFVMKGLTLIFLSVRTFFELVTSHPFVLGILFSFFLLYRLLPSLFHFLLSSSPVLVCTAVLLGTILSFGDHNYIPEFEVEEEKKEEVEEEEEKKSKNTHHENSSFLAGGIVQSNLVIEKDSVVTHLENKIETDEVAIEDEGEWVFIATEGDKLITDGTILTEEEPKEGHDKKQEIQEEKELHNLVLIEKKLLLEGGGASGACENDIEVQTSKSGNKKNEDLEGVGLFAASLDSSSLNEIEHSGRLSDSSTNQIESSSSDLFMEDLTTMLEELQPPLDVQPSQLALISLSDSDAESEQTLETNDSSIDSEEAEEWKLVSQEGGREVLVTWTKDDEKNFMGDLPNSDQESERISRIECVADYVEQESDSSEEVELVETDRRKKIDIYSEVGRSISRSQPIQSSTTKNMDLDLMQFNEGEVERYSYLELIHGVSLLEETRVGPAEFKLLKNNDLAFKQPYEGRVEKPVLESICEKSVFEETKFGSAKFLPPNQDENSVENGFEFSVSNARSLENTNSAFKLFHEGEFERPIVLKSINMRPNLEDTIVESTERWLSNEDHVILELPGLETSSPALCALRGHERPSFPESFNEKPRASDCKYPIDTHSDLELLEESSIGEIHLAPKEHSEGGMENIRKPSESEHGVEEIYLAPKEHSEGRIENIPELSESEHGVEENYLAPKEHSEGSIENIPELSESENSEGSIENIPKPSESEHWLEEIHLAPKEHSEGSMENIPKPSEHEVDEILAKQVESVKEVESGSEELALAWKNQTLESMKHIEKIMCKERTKHNLKN